MKRRKGSEPIIQETQYNVAEVIRYVEGISQEMPAHKAFEPDPRIIEEALKWAGNVPRKRAGMPTQNYVSVALDVFRKFEGVKFPFQKGVDEETLLLWGKYLGNVYATFLALRAGAGGGA